MQFTPPSPFDSIDENTLLELLLDSTASLPAVAKAAGIPLTTLAAWAAQPHIQEMLANLRALAEARLAIAAADQQLAARAALATVVAAQEQHVKQLAQRPDAQEQLSDACDAARKAATPLLKSPVPKREPGRDSSRKSEGAAPTSAAASISPSRPAPPHARRAA